jgi:hypothetical protein
MTIIWLGCAIGWIVIAVGRGPRRTRDYVYALWYVVLFAFQFRMYRKLKMAGIAEARKAAGQCPTCSYDLTGNVSGTCPECGTACTIEDQPAQ